MGNPIRQKENKHIIKAHKLHISNYHHNTVPDTTSMTHVRYLHASFTLSVIKHRMAQLPTFLNTLEGTFQFISSHLTWCSTFILTGLQETHLTSLNTDKNIIYPQNARAPLSQILQTR